MKVNLNNPIFNTDSYKYSHFLQYPSDVNYVTTYVEPRKGSQDIMFYGPQMHYKEYLSRRITLQNIVEAKKIVEAHGEPFNEDGFRRIESCWGGYWPVTIQSLPEGTVHRAGIPQLQITNNDPELPWVSTFIETALIRAVWYPSNVATRDLGIKRILKKYLEETADNTDGLLFKLHDFGARGVSSNESAGIGGAAHLVNFMGTDTVNGLIYAMNYYNSDVCGFSIPAAEHSTIISWGRDGETDAYRNMIRQFAGKNKLVAVVSDSYDIWNAVSNIWGDTLRKEVIEQGGTIIIRPDSGDPTKVPVELMGALGEKFGYTTNSKGFRMLPPYLRIIQGDGVNPQSIETCLRNVKSFGWSTDNLAFGMGGEMLQKHDRDTFYYAYKPNAVAGLDKEWRGVAKSPVGDPAKKSKFGRQAVYKDGDTLFAILEKHLHGLKNELQPVWKNGELLVDLSMDEVRKTAESYV